MKLANKFLFSMLLGGLFFPTFANAHIFNPPSKSVKCATKTFYLMESAEGFSFSLWAFYKRTANSNGIDEYTEAVKALIPDGYDINRAVLSCDAQALHLEIPRLEGEPHPSGRPNTLNLLVTNSGRVLDISSDP